MSPRMKQLRFLVCMTACVVGDESPPDGNLLQKIDELLGK
jgi:hypothetical protein